MELFIALSLGMLIVGSCLYLGKKASLVILIICSFVGGCSYINKVFKLQEDNFFEELIEDQIEKELNISIDLTPDSKETCHGNSKCRH